MRAGDEGRARPRTALALALALAMLALAFPAAAQEGAVFVRFERGVLHPVSVPDEEAVARPLSDVLANHSRRAWRFVPSTESHFPRLVVRVEEEHGDYVLLLRFQPAPEQDHGPLWSARLFGDGDLADLGGLPSASQMPGAIRDAFEAGLRTQGWLERNEGDLFVALREKAPVALSVQMHPGEPTALLALSGNQQQSLTDAEFRIVCRDRQGQGQRVHLRSRSNGVCRPLPDGSLEDAILLTHLEIRDLDEAVPVEGHLGRLDDLHPQRVLLEHLGTAGDGCGPTSLLTVDEEGL